MIEKMTEEQINEAIRKARSEYFREYRRSHKDKINAYHRQWRKEHPEQVKEYGRRTWLKKIGVGATFEADEEQG